MIRALCYPQSLRCVTHKACVASLTKPALRHPQSLRCVTHKACVVSPTKPALPVSHWEGCLPRCGRGVFLEAGRVSSSVREGGLPRGGRGVFLEAGRVSSSMREGCLPSVRGNGLLTSSSRLITPPETINGQRPAVSFGVSHWPLVAKGEEDESPLSTRCLGARRRPGCNNALPLASQ